MTVRGGVTISSSSRCLLAGSMLRDTANESRYDGSRWDDVGLLSFRCLLAAKRYRDGSRQYDDKTQSLMEKTANASEKHSNFIFICSFYHILIFQRAAGLNYSCNSMFCTFYYAIWEWKKCI